MNDLPIQNSDLLYLVSKLKLVSGHHVYVVIDGQDALGLNFFIWVESIAEFILPCLNHLEGNTDLGP